MQELTHRVLVGGTASGKKTVAAALCRRHGWLPLSMDSMKVYRGMDIGTDKPPRALVEELDWQLLDLVGQQLTKAIGHMDEVHRSGPRSRCAGNDAPAAGQGKGRQAEPSGTVL